MLDNGFTRWLFESAFSITVAGQRYVPDWDAIGAIADALAFFAALATIYYSIRLVQRQMAQVEAHELSRTEGERLRELKRVEQEYLNRIFDVADLTYQRLQELSSRVSAANAGRQSGITVETGNGPAEALRDYAATTAAVLNIVKASRLYRFPRGTQDVVFEKYETTINSVVKYNTDLLKAFLADPANGPSLMISEESQMVLYLNQFAKSCTGKLIALMFGTGPEWNAPEFVQFVESIVNRRSKKTAKGASPSPIPSA